MPRAAQVKAVDIHTNSRRIEGNAAAIANQLDVALSLDVVKMVGEGAARDEIMIRVGMLLMLDQLDCASGISQASKPHEDGSGSSNRI